MSPQSATKEERAKMRDEIVEELRANGFSVDSKNIVSLGRFDLYDLEFKNGTSEDFMKKLLTVAIAKNITLFVPS